MKILPGSECLIPPVQLQVTQEDHPHLEQKTKKNKEKFLKTVRFFHENLSQENYPTVIQELSYLEAEFKKCHSLIPGSLEEFESNEKLLSITKKIKNEDLKIIKKKSDQMDLISNIFHVSMFEKSPQEKYRRYENKIEELLKIFKVNEVVCLVEKAFEKDRGYKNILIGDIVLNYAQVDPEKALVLSENIFDEGYKKSVRQGVLKIIIDKNEFNFLEKLICCQKEEFLNSTIDQLKRDKKINIFIEYLEKKCDKSF